MFFGYVCPSPLSFWRYFRQKCYASWRQFSRWHKVYVRSVHIVFGNKYLMTDLESIFSIFIEKREEKNALTYYLLVFTSIYSRTFVAKSYCLNMFRAETFSAYLHINVYLHATIYNCMNIHLTQCHIWCVIVLFSIYDILHLWHVREYTIMYIHNLQYICVYERYNLYSCIRRVCLPFFSY